MILYAHSHKSGAKNLAYKYKLRYALPKEYVTEKDLKSYGVIIERERLIRSIQSHPNIYAYVLPNLSICFHPDTTVPIIANAFKKYFSGFL
jgi:hypothetical protein